MGPTAIDLCWETAGGWTHLERLQHSEGVYFALGPPPPRRCHRAVSRRARTQIQLREDDLPQMLRTIARSGSQLPQEEMWPHQHAPPKEEVEVSRHSCENL